MQSAGAIVELIYRDGRLVLIWVTEEELGFTLVV